VGIRRIVIAVDIDLVATGAEFHVLNAVITLLGWYIEPRRHLEEELKILAFEFRLMAGADLVSDRGGFVQIDRDLPISLPDRDSQPKTRRH
jgi:hypothetical protein